MQKSGMVVITAITGMGGVGKTELAIRYAKEHEASYPGGICWFSARESNLAAEIIQFARLYMKLEVPQELAGKPLVLKQQVEWCWQNWQSSSGLVLLVLDDVTNLRSCRELLPKANHFRVLITTRLRSMDSSVVEEISLDVLEPKDALQLLTSLVDEKRVQRELQTAKELCQWLGYLPLGLQLVGVYLAKKPPNWSLTKILQRLKEQKLLNEALNPSQQQLEQTLNTAQRGIFAAFEFSWQELNPTTRHVAKLLSLFAQNDFLWEWINSASQHLSLTESEIETANDELYQHHLVQWIEEKEGYCRIHTLIRQFLQDKLASNSSSSIVDTTKELQISYKQAFAAVMVEIAKEIAESPTREFITSVQDAIPHLIEVAQSFIEAVRDEDLIFFFVGLGTFYIQQGLYTLAENWYIQCLSIVKIRLGEEHTDFVESLSNLAEIYKLLGKYTEAEHLVLQVLALKKSLLGEEHPDIAEILNKLGVIYYSLGRYAEAEPLYLKALEMKKSLLGEEHPDIAESFNNLALLYNSLGRYTEAEPLYLKALEMRKRLLQEEHPYIAITLNNLALLYDSLGKYTEAEPLYLKVLEKRKRILGEEHPKVAMTLNNLALLYYHQGHYNEAEKFSLQAVKIDKHFLGEENPDFATDLHNLALIYSAQKRYGEAEISFLRVMEIKQRSLPKDHPLLTDTIYALGKMYKQMGCYSKAEPLCIKALELDKNLLGDEHPCVATSLNNLAELYNLEGRYTEAKPLFIQALKIWESRLGMNHPNTVICRNNLENPLARISSIPST
ncbi:tetratricopeptide repeat protein [Nostoc sp. JL31]|uniref:tetratricopeptide repeat protein n=1 Tax=Nostoc sp. JL31 TaxID=2815395 RepID=UPI0025CF4161|nr:tetratricopeptide repeat protein [Nostoc sp. JL31]